MDITLGSLVGIFLTIIGIATFAMIIFKKGLKLSSVIMALCALALMVAIGNDTSKLASLGNSLINIATNVTTRAENATYEKNTNNINEDEIIKVSDTNE